jgi:hypothetical protein
MSIRARRATVVALLALGACATEPLVGDTPVAMTDQSIAPYEFLEQCADLAVDDRLDYRFESKAPVHFEIYYKDGITYVATVTRDEVTSDSGIFRAPIARRYCARWEAGQEGAIVDLRLRVVRVKP